MQTHHSFSGRYYVWIFKGPSPELKINWTWGRRVLAPPLSILKTAAHIKREGIRKCYLLSLLLFFPGARGVWCLGDGGDPTVGKGSPGPGISTLSWFQAQCPGEEGMPHSSLQGSNISLHGTKSKASLPLLTK